MHPSVIKKISIVSLPPRTDNIKRKIQDNFIKTKEGVNIQCCTVSVEHVCKPLVCRVKSTRSTLLCVFIIGCCVTQKTLSSEAYSKVNLSTKIGNLPGDTSCSNKDNFN